MMKSSLLLLLCTLLVGTSAFVPMPQMHRTTTSLPAMIPEEEMTADQLEIQKIVNKWREIRFLTREEADAQLDGEWLEAYNRWHEKYEEDMELMMEIKEKVGLLIEPPKVSKKGLKQKKREKWAKAQERMAREAARRL